MTTPGSIRNVYPARIPPPHPTIDWISCEPLHRKNTISNIGPCNNQKCTPYNEKGERMEHNSPGILEDMIDSVIEKCNIPRVPKNLD